MPLARRKGSTTGRSLKLSKSPEGTSPTAVAEADTASAASAFKSVNVHIRSLPWDQIASFLDLNDFLTSRIICHDILTVLHEELGPEDCSRWICERLKLQKVWAIHSLDEWRDASQVIQDTDVWHAFFKPREETSTSSMTTLLRLFRCIQYIPEEAVVHFREEQRLLTKMDENHLTTFTSYGKCRQSECSLCQEDPEPEEKKLSVEYCKLTGYHNLPEELFCPFCADSNPGRSTLKLEDMSYVSKNYHEEPVQNTLDFDPVPSLVAHKRRRSAEEIPPPNFPPRVSGNMKPGRDTRVACSGFTKHALTLSCGKCREFALIAPAGYCYQSSFSCHTKSRGTELGIDNQVGGVLRRTRCAQAGCNQVVLCSGCSRADAHPRYQDVGEAHVPLFHRTLFCGRCHKTYCWDHSNHANKCCRDRTPDYHQTLANFLHYSDNEQYSDSE